MGLAAGGWRLEEGWRRWVPWLDEGLLRSRSEDGAFRVAAGCCGMVVGDKLGVLECWWAGQGVWVVVVGN